MQNSVVHVQMRSDENPTANPTKPKINNIFAFNFNQKILV